MQVELFGVLGHQPIDDLLVAGRPQDADGKRLRLASLKEGRSVGAGKDPHLHLQRPDLLE